ncbi:oligogalacturonate-specific porin KdgM family protein, partial [Escherichia coli]|uniref:oligogalacturonate-specific porin KdgM family protein n=1 Tax=Escherichia coli TaxID=562 RepID=UPI002916165A
MMNPVPWLQMTNMISYQGLVRTFPNTFRYRINEHWLPYFELRWLDRNVEPYHREQNQIRIGTKYFF